MTAPAQQAHPPARAWKGCTNSAPDPSEAPPAGPEGDACACPSSTPPSDAGRACAAADSATKPPAADAASSPADTKPQAGDSPTASAHGAPLPAGSAAAAAAAAASPLPDAAVVTPPVLPPAAAAGAGCGAPGRGGSSGTPYSSAIRRFSLSAACKPGNVGVRRVCEGSGEWALIVRRLGVLGLAGGGVGVHGCWHPSPRLPTWWAVWWQVMHSRTMSWLLWDFRLSGKAFLHGVLRMDGAGGHQGGERRWWVAVTDAVKDCAVRWPCAAAGHCCNSRGRGGAHLKQAGTILYRK
jgi:hypothetical protein